MGNSIYSNLSSLAALRHLNETSEQLQLSSARLASGNRIQRAGDDPSGLAKSAFLEVDLRDQRQIERNAQDAKSILQVTENSLNEVNNLLMRLREVSVAAASDIAGPEERDALNIEAAALRDEIERIAQTTTYGRHTLLNGSTPDLSFQVGIGQDEQNRIQYPASTIDMQTGTLGIDSLDLSDPESALSSMEALDEAILKVQAARAQTGAYQSRLDSVASLAQQKSQVLAGDLSRVKDTDYGLEISNFVSRQIQQNAAVAVLSQANQQSETALRLLMPFKWA